MMLNNSYEIKDEDGSNQWPEFVKFLFECTLSSNVDMKESALIIFRYIICQPQFIFLIYDDSFPHLKKFY